MPSNNASAWPWMTLMGVRSSWAISAIRLRRSCSWRARLAAIWLKAAPTRPSSSLLLISTRVFRSPPAMRPAARANSRNGAVIWRTSNPPRIKATLPAANAARNTARFTRARNSARSGSICGAIIPAPWTSSAPTVRPRTTMGSPLSHSCGDTWRPMSVRAVSATTWRVAASTTSRRLEPIMPIMLCIMGMLPIMPVPEAVRNRWTPAHEPLRA